MGLCRLARAQARRYCRKCGSGERHVLGCPGGHCITNLFPPKVGISMGRAKYYKGTRYWGDEQQQQRKLIDMRPIPQVNKGSSRLRSQQFSTGGSALGP